MAGYVGNADIYTGEQVVGAAGEVYEVVDPAKLDFEGAGVWARKVVPTYVRRAVAGELVQTVVYMPDGGSVVERDATPAKEGQWVMMNKLPSGDDQWLVGEKTVVDRYVLPPGGLPEGHSWVVLMPKEGLPERVMVGVVDKPAVVKTSWGQHMIFPGGSIKRNADGSISGINPEPFAVTWRLTDEQGVVMNERGRE